jgi:hypothetical protein
MGTRKFRNLSPDLLETMRAINILCNDYAPKFRSDSLTGTLLIRIHGLSYKAIKNATNKKIPDNILPSETRREQLSDSNNGGDSIGGL